ncbi:MAG: GDP-mannose 4,6-dehydratase, partial [Candidatus Omnitrophica bacterium]|nr:GDP-mannose 4,6-dehydratase [Candidatus Omnitrophota bacterium]
ETRYRYKTKKGVPETLSVDLTGHTPYGASKYTGDIYTQEYGHIYGMKTAVFRMSCIYGTRQFGFEDQGWVAWFVIANLTGQPIIVYGDGKQVRDLLYVDDLVEAYDKFIQGETGHDVFNIGGGPRNTTSLLEFIALIENKTGIKFRKVEHKEWRPSDQKVYISDIGKVSKSLTWKPKTTPEKGLEKLIEWVGANTKYFI